MIDIDLKQWDELERDLRKFKETAVPYAVRSSLTSVAYMTQDTARKKVQSEFILRNAYTKRSILVEPARGSRIDSMSSRIGSTESYMETQEFGGFKAKKGKKGVAIPTSYAANLPETAEPRTKLPTESNKLQNILLRRNTKKRARNSKQDLIIKAHEAVKSGRRHVFLELGNKKKWGIYKIVGGSKETKRGWPKEAKLKMLYSLGNTSVGIPKRPWLKPSSDFNYPKMPDVYADKLRYQLRRLNLFD